MDHQSVLVLLAARNGSTWIVEQIESILAQVGVDVTLLISDDSSTDDTRSKVIHYVDSDVRVRLTSPGIPTGSAAQNFLWLIRSTVLEGHTFVAFADQDDVWHTDKLSRGIDLMRHCAASGYSCSVNAFWSDGGEMTLGQSDRLTASDFLFEGAGQGCTYVLTAELYLRARAFFAKHESECARLHYHDWAIYALSRSWKLGWAFDRQVMLRYRQHPSNDTGARYSFGGVRRRLSLLGNGWYAEQLHVIARICSLAAPDDPLIQEWCRILGEPVTFTRRYWIARFCLRGGRRRAADRAILVGAALLGWL